MKLFTIKDTKADYYYPPQAFKNSAEAVRAIQNSVNNQKDSLFSQNAEDFILFQIADWNETNGMVDPSDKKHIADLIDLRVE